MDVQVFVQLSLILVLTTLIVGAMRFLKQPAVIGYILSGIVAGPLVFNLVDSTNTLAAFAQIGVVLLLFFVGLNLNPNVIKDIGKVSLITGLGQIIFTSTIGFVIAYLLGFSLITSFYLSIALAFSSTIIIMKLLSDKKDLESLHGKISVGFLIVQDFVAIGVLLVVSSINSTTNAVSLAVQTLAKGAVAVVILFLVARYVLRKLMNHIAKSQEFLLLFSISWCFAIASIFYLVDFSIEAGALLAGISLSMTPFHFEVSSKMKPIRDFFLVLFFVMLGSQMVFSNIIENSMIIIIFSLFVLIGNPLIVMALMGALGYTKRTGFLAGLTVAQISEFSFIVIALGVSLGQVTSEVLSIVTAVGIITFAGSTYMIMYSHKIYPVIAPYLSMFERRGKKKDSKKSYKNKHYEIILFGYNRIGYDILESLKKMKKQFLIIDYDPEVITKLQQQKYNCFYGDANDTELLDELNFKKAKMVISTIPIQETNLMIMKKVKKNNRKTILAMVSHHLDDAEELYEKGATYVIMPHFLGGKHFSTMIEKNKMTMNKFLKERIRHIKHISKRKKLGHQHPSHQSK